MYTVSSVVPAGDEEIPAEDVEAEELLAAGLEEAADEFPNEDAGAEDSGIGMVLTVGSVAAEESGLPAAEDRMLSVSAAEETGKDQMTAQRTAILKTDPDRMTAKE